MSGYANISAVPDQNILYNAASGQTLIANQRNQLLNQETQQTIGGNEIEMIGRAAGTLMDKTLYPTPEARAAAYPVLVGALQRQGFAKNAPATYPGDDQMAGLARLGTPSADLYKYGQAGTAIPTPGFNTGAAPPAAGGGGTNAPPGTSTPAAPLSLADIHPDLTQFRLPSGAGATVAKSAAPQFQGLLTDLEAAGYKLDPDTTGGYNPRNIAGTNTPSQHAYGLAMDVNWARNPRGANTQADIPPDLARSLAAKWGLTWGGDWQGADRDPMHFEVARGSGPGTDHPKGVATGWNANNPLNLTTDTGGVVTPGGARLANFGSMADGVAATAAKLQSYQTDRGLNTVRQMYTEWHKGSAVNDADMQRIAGAMGVGVDQPFQLDPTKTAAWITAAQPGETGTAGKRLSQADIVAGVRQASAGPVAPAGGVAARTGGTNTAGPGAGSGTAAAAQTPLPPDQAKARAATTGQPVPVAGVQGLWALPDGTVTQTPPAATPASAQQPPAAPATAPAQVAPVAVPAPPEMDQSNLTRQDYQDLDRARRSGMTGPQLTQEVQQRQVANLARQERYRADVRQAANDAQAANEKAKADAIAAENLRLSQEGGQRDTERLRLAQITSQREQDAAAREAQRLAIEQKKAEQGSTQADRDSYTLRTEDPSSQQYVDAWSRKKWTVAPNGNVIENDVSQYPAPTRSIQRPSFLPAPTPQGLDEVRKADTDGKVITSAIDHYLDVYKATGGGGWDAYFANPQNPKTQQLLGAFDRMKTVLRSPVYYNTGVLQPAEISMMGQDLVSPQTLRGAFASPEALATRLGEIKLAILTRQDAELRSVGRDGVIVRDKADYNKIPDGGQYYDEEGHLKIKTGKQ